MGIKKTILQLPSNSQVHVASTLGEPMQLAINKEMKKTLPQSKIQSRNQKYNPAIKNTIPQSKIRPSNQKYNPATKNMITQSKTWI